MAHAEDFPYVSFLNFGNTLQTQEPIRSKLWHGMLPSLMLMIPIFLGELVIGIILAMFSCICRKSDMPESVTVTPGTDCRKRNAHSVIDTPGRKL